MTVMISMHTRRAVLYLIPWIAIPLTAATAMASPPKVEPCSLLTTSEVEQVIGKLKGTPRADKEGAASWCNYEFANGKDAMGYGSFPPMASNGGGTSPRSLSR